MEPPTNHHSGTDSRLPYRSEMREAPEGGLDQPLRKVPKKCKGWDGRSSHWQHEPLPYLKYTPRPPGMSTRMVVNPQKESSKNKQMARQKRADEREKLKQQAGGGKEGKQNDSYVLTMADIADVLAAKRLPTPSKASGGKRKRKAENRENRSERGKSDEAEQNESHSIENEEGSSGNGGAQTTLPPIDSSRSRRQAE